MAGSLRYEALFQPVWLSQLCKMLSINMCKMMQSAYRFHRTWRGTLDTGLSSEDQLKVKFPCCFEACLHYMKVRGGMNLAVLAC